jgi:hypothetical protein
MDELQSGPLMVKDALSREDALALMGIDFILEERLEDPCLYEE